MSIDISVPGGNPNKPGFSVQRSANGLSISAGALADSPAKFGVMNDEGGLSVSAWPIARDVRNLCLNPRTHFNETDWWSPVGVHARITSPPVALPDGADACLRYSLPYWGAAGWFCDTIELPPGWTSIYIEMQWWGEGLSYTGGEMSFGLGYPFLTAEGVYAGMPALSEAGGDGYPGVGFQQTWYRATGLSAETKYVRVTPSVFGGNTNTPPDNFLYLTECMVTDVPRTYADGDSAGWAWDGTPHNSASRHL